MRDIIQVERQDGLGNGPDSGSGSGPDSGSGSIAQLARVADELLPPLVARLGVSELAEIEVRQGTWRVRIRRAAARDGMTQMATAHPAAGTSSGPPSPASAPTGGSHGGAHPGTLSGGAHGASTGTPSDQPMARSTAVGYFGLRPGLAVGHRVARGDALGWVDVLGVRMEIIAPAAGVIERFVTEPGDPVEYGQELVAILAPAGSGASPTGAVDDADGATSEAAQA